MVYITLTRILQGGFPVIVFVMVDTKTISYIPVVACGGKYEITSAAT